MLSKRGPAEPAPAERVLNAGGAATNVPAPALNVSPSTVMSIGTDADAGATVVGSAISP
jgi:hypothetical protein